MSKAFDTVNHAILIDKLEHYGIRGLALKWLCSHLSDRKQYVECNGVASEYLTVKCGVPQGSILLYINDIHLSSSLLKFILFADDTNVLFSNADFNMLRDILNSELEKVSNWLMANKLTVNIKKTNYVIFKVRQKQLPSVPFNIRINNKTRCLERTC